MKKGKKHLSWIQGITAPEDYQVCLHGEPLWPPFFRPPLLHLPPYCRHSPTRECLWTCASILSKLFRLIKRGGKILHLPSPYQSCHHYSSHFLECFSIWAPQLYPWTSKKEKQINREIKQTIFHTSTSPHVGTIQKIIHWEAFPVQSSFSSRFLNLTIWEQELGVPFTWSKTPSKCLSKIKSMGFLQKWPYSPGAAGRIAGRCHKRSLSLLHMVPVYLQRGSVRLLFSSFCSWEIWGSENLNTLSMVSLQATVKIANTHEIGQNSRHQNLLGKDKSQLPGLMRAKWVPSFPDSLSVQGGVEEVKMVFAGCLMGRPLGFWFCDGNRMSTSLPWEKPFPDPEFHSLQLVICLRWTLTAPWCHGPRLYDPKSVILKPWVTSLPEKPQMQLLPEIPVVLVLWFKIQSFFLDEGWEDVARHRVGFLRGRI